MRTFKAWWLGWSVLAAGLIVLPLTHGQVPPRPGPVPAPAAEPVAVRDHQPDPNLLGPLGRQMFLNGRRGAEWLFRANRADGRFIDGLRPDLNAAATEVHYLHQVEAAQSLARAARFYREDRHTARARQAALALLLDTKVDPADPTVRQPTVPADPLASAGALLVLIADLPEPGEDLVHQSEQLASFLRRHLQPDGTLRLGEARPASEALGLHGLIRSHAVRPAPWKVDALRKALVPCRAEWRADKSMRPAPRLTAAFTEAYLATGESAFADFVFELNDYLITRQYQEIDPRQPLWLGGFRTGAADEAPQAGSAFYTRSLADACRAARQAGDLEHYRRFRDGLERALQFLSTLQYTEANTQHFADWYRPSILGGMFASHHDGQLRLDYTADTVAALVAYLQMGD